mmetsp:Transcript_46603/g.110825  ORF Transcript_46603/g.110825 Transcript_46603/m.110825 type:complete len:507 (+) Transcript_46603:108-1628(+)
MSKYSKLSFSNGNSQFFLQRTLTEHDRSMDHPWMQMVYGKTFTLKQYGAWLAQMHAVFTALEDAAKDLEMLRSVHGADLPRRSALEADLLRILGEGWEQEAKDIVEASAATQAYLRDFSGDGAEPCHILAHHFLQYNAVLSGGAFLGQMVSQFLALPHGAPGVSFYAFPGVEAGKEAARVQHYLRQFDKLDLTDEQRESMLTVMKKIYKDTEVMMTEIYDLNPIPGKSYADAQRQGAPPVVHASPEDMIELTLAELHGYTGAGEGQILMSLAGELLDITAGRELYGAGGGYHLLAGHDVTRCLTTMSLEPDDLDDLKFTPQTLEDEKTLKNWQEKLREKYPVIGKLKSSDGDDDPTQQSDQGLRQRLAAAMSTPLTATSGSASSSTAAAASDGGKKEERCPISGKVGIGCPMSMFMGGAAKPEGKAEAKPQAVSQGQPSGSAFMAGKSMITSVTESKPVQDETLFFKLCPLHWDDQTMKLLLCVASIAWFSGIFIGWNLHKQYMAS